MEMVDISKLLKISTYALKIKKSRGWVNKLIQRGDLEIVIIDGVKFVVV